MLVKDNDQFMIRLRKDVSFLNKPIIKNKLEKIPDNSFLLIDTSRAEFIDKDVIDVIKEFNKHAALKNINVELKTNPNNPLHSLLLN
jgi:MFS superfamily sulfate permease-like transporter